MVVTGIQLLFSYPENHMEIWLVNLFLSRKKFHAKQMFVLSSSMKLGPGPSVSQLFTPIVCILNDVNTRLACTRVAFTVFNPGCEKSQYMLDKKLSCEMGFIASFFKKIHVHHNIPAIYVMDLLRVLRLTEWTEVKIYTLTPMSLVGKTLYSLPGTVA